MMKTSRSDCNDCANMLVLAMREIVEFKIVILGGCPLTAKVPVEDGSASKCHLSMKDVVVSGRHRLWGFGEGVKLEDVGNNTA